MYKIASTFFISALLCFQVSHEASLSPVEKIGGMLNVLEQYQSSLLTGLFDTYYVPYSDQVDSAALATKNNSKDDVLIKCVNNRTTEAITTIFSEFMNYTTYYMKPIAEGQKHLIACGLTDSTDAECANGVMKDLQSTISLLGNNTETEIAADSETIKEKVSLIEACGNQTVNSRKGAKPAGLPDDAQATLVTLRQLTEDNVILWADMSYINMSILVASTAHSEKSNNKQMECVNGHANEAIDFIYEANINLTEKFFKRLYDAEIQLVLCGASDEACSKAIGVALLSEVDSTSDESTEQIKMDLGSLQKHLSAMSACPVVSGAVVNSIIIGFESSVLLLFTIVMYLLQ